METAILILLLLAGQACHFLKKVIEDRRNGSTVTLYGYWVQNPYHTAISVIASAAAFLLLYDTPELTRATAWAIGYMGDSVAGMIGKRKTEGVLG